MYGAVVRAVRRERGLTQRELSTISGIDQPNISAIENDRREPTVGTLHRLLQACGYQLVASAGSSAGPIAFVDDDVAELRRTTEAPADDSEADRVTKVTAVLELADTILRSR